MKNINVNFENFRNKHKLSLMRVLVSGTLAINTIFLSSCGSKDNNEEVVLNEEENLSLDNEESEKYFDKVVEIETIRTLYIDCADFSEEIRTKEIKVPSTFYDKINSFLENDEYKSVMFLNDRGIIDYSKIDLSKVEDVEYENCFVYDENGEYIFKDPTSSYIDAVLKTDWLCGTIYIDCDGFPEKIKNKEAEVPSSFYSIVNNFIKDDEYNSIKFLNDDGIIDYSKINLANILNVEYETCYIYDNEGNLIFEDPTSPYIDFVIDTDWLGSTICINCDEFPEEIKNKKVAVPSSFYKILNNRLKTGDYKSMIFYNDTGIINHSAISSDYVEEVRFEPSLGVPTKYLLK